MLVFGDRRRTASPAASIEALEARLARLAPSGRARLEALSEAFVAAAELAQGLADAVFAERGEDGPADAPDAAAAVVLELARCLAAAWRDQPPPASPALDGLRGQPLPPLIEPRTGEGYAFYALYPETYAEAAAGSGLGPDTLVIGLRSIGLGLAAMVAAEIGAEPPVSVRPVGHPFRRELRLSRTYQDRLRRARTVAVADEGPGLSGSSFQAVAEALERAGAAPERVVYFPSHPGPPGPQADPQWRRRWETLERRVTGFDQAVAPRLAAWVEDLTGRAQAPPVELSGGAWRGLAHPDEAAWPPADSLRERRKFRLEAAGGTWLLKFAGLGPGTAAKHARAAALAQAGFTPAMAGLRHGFLVERWIERAEAPLDRRALIERMGAYLGFRARRFPARDDDGAPLAVLWDMARVNAAEALGRDAAAGLDRWAEALPDLEPRVRRVFTDNRLHPWEWIAAQDGRILKTDAVDHAEAHDLVGAQDVAWDFAGAWAEFGLSPAEEARLAQAAGLAPDPDLLAFLKPCYLAFQLGAFALAAGGHGHWPAEAGRLRRRSDTYAIQLSRALTAPSTRRERPA